MTTATLEIVTLQSCRDLLQREFGRSRLVKIVTQPSPQPSGQRMVVASTEDLQDTPELVADLIRKAKEAFAQLTVVFFEWGKARSISELLQSTVLLARVPKDPPYVAPDTSSVRRLALAKASGAESRLIASASLQGRQLSVWSCEPKLYRVPVEQIPALARLNESVLQDFKVSESGSRISWPGADVDLDLDTLRAYVDPKVRREHQQRFRKEAQQYGRAIRKLRESKGLRQSDIEGLTDRELRRLEKGEVFPHPSTLKKLADSHGMPVEAYMAKLAKLSADG